MQNREIINTLTRLTNLRDKRVPYVLGRAITKNINLLNEESKIIDDERKRICEKYSEKDKDGNPITEDGNYKLNNKAEFEKEMTALFDTEVDVEIKKVNEDNIVAQCDNDKFDSLTISEIELLDFMME